MVAMPEGEISVTSHFAPLIPNSWYSDLLTSGLSEKLEVRNQEGAHNSYSAPIPPFFYYIKQFVHHLYKTPRRFLILCAVPSLLTPNSSLDSEVDLHASYLENEILCTPDSCLHLYKDEHLCLPKS